MARNNKKDKRYEYHTNLDYDRDTSRPKRTELKGYIV
jgi:hypothetical protein